MKELCDSSPYQITPERKNKWKRLFSSRQTRKRAQLCSPSAHTSSFFYDSDQSSQSTDDNQNNVDYFDFSFLEEWFFLFLLTLHSSSFSEPFPDIS